MTVKDIQKQLEVPSISENKELS